METALERARATVLADLEREGFSVCPRLSPELTTSQVANRIGKMVDVSELLPGSGIPPVQTLIPRQVDEAGPNQYSGNYGLGAFPLHTDLAHWAIPPHYFILRCIVGSKNVLTNLLSRAEVLKRVGASTAGRAVFRIRKPRAGHCGLLRAMGHTDGAELFRWDPIFLLPFNVQAQQMASTIMNSDWHGMTHKILLQHPGDTIVIDNWRSLHGRANVTVDSMTRRIERAYLSEVWA